MTGVTFNNTLDYENNGLYTHYKDTIIFGCNQWNNFVVDGNNDAPNIQDRIESALLFGYISSPTVGSLIDNDNNLTI
ncbi:hypothetical protein ACFLSQ_04190 [Bacteroidota bacterium]